MSVEVRVPTLPESVADATLLSWHKQPGEAVQRDENLVDLETDKVVLEIPAPADGVLGQILQESGATVVAGDIIALIEEGSATATTPVETPAKSDEVATQSASLSPAVRRMVAEHDLDPSQIPATGRNGRLTKADIVNYMRTADEAPAAAPAAPSAAPAPVQAKEPPSNKPAASAPVSTPTGERRLEQRVPMTRLRSRIAERLVEAQQTAAMLTTFNEVNMQPVMALRKTYQDKFEKEHGVRLGFMSFFVKACIEALKRFPAVNGSIDGSDIIYHGYYDIGIAVSSPRGLVVPILRDVDQMSFADIENTIRAFGQRAEEGSLTMEDLTGGTFSITNGGVFGSMMSTPILNPPQSAILGMHSIMERPMAINGEVVIVPMMYLAVTYDHRIIDGREAVSFLVTIKECLEDPARLLLQI